MSTLLTPTHLVLLTLLNDPDRQLLPLSLVVLVAALFVLVLVMNRIVLRRVRRSSEQSRRTVGIMEQAIKSSGNNVVYFDIAKRHIAKLYGHLLPDEGISSDEWKQHVHPDDLDMVVFRIQQMITGEQETADLNYRWNFSYSGGTPRWGWLHNVSVVDRRQGMNRPVGIVSTLVDETEMHRRQEEEQDLTGKFRLIFEQSIIGLSFYDADGWLLDANKNMRRICHFDSEDGDAFFSKANLFDMPPFRDHVDRNHLEEFWVCTQSVIPERNIYAYLEVRLHPIYDEAGALIYIAIAARDVSEERQLYLQARLNDEQIQQANETIQLYETELRYMMQACDMHAWRMDFNTRRVEFYTGLSTVERAFSMDDFAALFVNDREQIAPIVQHPERYFEAPRASQYHMRPIFENGAAADTLVWNQFNVIPVRDDEGRLTGCFGLVRNITSLLEKQEQLRRETERANDSGRQKSVFLANMTHEIRTPLNAIVGFSDLLQAIEAPEEKREMIRIIHNNCDMLLRLINDIMELSNVDANVMQIRRETIDFAHAFDDICQSLAQRVSEPAVTFRKDNPLPTLMLDIDLGRVQQVITNFVTNAVKYTHEGHICVGYRMEERSLPEGSVPRRWLYVYCEDTGSGIPKDQCARVFERFVKLNDFIQGTGLGLSICKAIIEKCGGQIGVDSEVGQGSTFWFRIPV